MLATSPALVDLIRQLESTPEKHTGMFNKVLQAIQGSKTAIETLLETIQMVMELLRADHTKLAERVDKVESSLTSVQPSLVAIQEQLKLLQTEVCDLKARVEDLEGHSKCNTIGFLGFIDRVEVPNMNWLSQMVLVVSNGPG
ncbi:hypothetical protein NDU88_003337 [Pleurodeles waltl]|uniref:Uncharacterized protein n=1 Tax=Pleurodeles waltl TaxID=8319 RepID=A0AAV7T5U9_PLEWA|nr:hypothetical protein NDU88_003337 [Pleurodeles waltl]